MASLVKGGLDQSRFKRSVAAQKKQFKLSAYDFLTKQGRLLVRDLIKLTPGFVPGPGIMQTSLASHKRITDNAVKRDLRKLFKPIKKTRLYNSDGRAGERLKALLKKGDKDAIRAVFKAAGVQVAEKATRELHLKNRGKRGRVSGRTSIVVLDEKSLPKYEKEVLTHVGRGKAGWETAWNALTFGSLPHWIGRHNTPGLFTDNRRDPVKPDIIVGNNVEYRGDFKPQRIVRAAINIRAAAMRTEVKKVQAAMARAFNTKR